MINLNYVSYEIPEYHLSGSIIITRYDFENLIYLTRYKSREYGIHKIYNEYYFQVNYD